MKKKKSENAVGVHVVLKETLLNEARKKCIDQGLFFREYIEGLIAKDLGVK